MFKIVNPGKKPYNYFYMDMESEQLQEVSKISEEQQPKRGVLFYACVLGGGLIILAVVAAIIGYGYVFAQIRKPMLFPETRMFVVAKGESTQAIARDLETKGLVSRGFYFWFYVWQDNLSRSLQAGTYAVEGTASVKDIADMIARGAVVRDTIRVTIPEGFTMREIDARVREVGLLKNETKHLTDLTVDDFKPQYDFLGSAPARVSLEGYLFPDTYEFKKDASLAVVVETMLSNFEKKVDGDVLVEMQKQGKTMHEIIIMASIIEREVITSDDMKTVSGILWKRLAIGMPLQVDATVIYATGKNDITRADLAVDSPYNTYLYKGLPKGPIANPGLNAIIAAVEPIASDYLFYISKPTKETVFSRTLQEHNAAVMKYLK